MKTQNTKICPECKKKVVVSYAHMFGIRLVEEIKGKSFYGAKCPKCKHEWWVKK